MGNLVFKISFFHRKTILAGDMFTTLIGIQEPAQSTMVSSELWLLLGQAEKTFNSRCYELSFDFALFVQTA